MIPRTVRVQFQANFYQMSTLIFCRDVDPKNLGKHQYLADRLKTTTIPAIQNLLKVARPKMPKVNFLLPREYSSLMLGHYQDELVTKQRCHFVDGQVYLFIEICNLVFRSKMRVVTSGSRPPPRLQI